MERYQTTISQIDLHLNQVFENSSPHLNRLLESINYSIKSGGKRLRPLFMVLLGQGLGVKDEKIFPYAIALELIHTYSLIHDDLPAMDNDDLRRGKPTNHKVYGEAMAILAGDGLLTHACNYLLEKILEDREELSPKIHAMKFLLSMAGIEGMVGGQAIDVTYSISSVDEQILEEMVDKKTVALFRAAFVVPAILAEMKPWEVNRFDNIAICIGRAFQIRDDILDFEEDKKINKPTYATVLGYENSQQLVEYYTDKAISTLQEIKNMDEIIKLTKALTKRSF